jgi:hypothetical protein
VERARFTELRAGNAMWDVMPDGRLLVVQRGVEEDDPRRFDVVVNWAAELRAAMAKTGAARR